MTTINDIHDLVELLQNHPEWAETLRTLILTRELLGLPETLARALQDWAETNRSLTRVETSQRLLHGRLGQLAGMDYERLADRLMARLLYRERGVADAVTLQRGWGTPDPGYADEIANICRHALQAGYISTDEDTELFRADMILQGWKDNAHVYVVVEASVTAGSHDFQRAEARAQILSRALGPVQEAVVESAVVADSLAADVVSSNYQATSISMPYRREEFQTALDAVDAAIAANAGSRA